MTNDEHSTNQATTPSTPATEWTPKIISFNCWKWGYGAADMAGTMRVQYPASLRPIRVICAGRVSTDLVLRTLGKGADGVLIVAWRPGECDFTTGNAYATKNIKLMQQIVSSFGIDGKRVGITYCSAAEGKKFQEDIQAFDVQIRELGPNQLKKYAEINYDAAQARIAKKNAAKLKASAAVKKSDS